MAVVAALGIVLVWKIVPGAAATEQAGKFDLLGALGLGAALVCLLLAVSKGADWGWGSITVLGLFAGAVVLFLLWGVWELRTRDALVDLRVTASRPVLLTNAASILVGFALYSQSLIISQILQLPTQTGYGLGQSMLQMGLWMAPSGIAMMLISPVGARLTAARGPKTTLIVGAIIMGAGYAGAALIMGTVWGLLVATSVSGIGVGFAYGAMPALIMSSVPSTETGSANSFNSLMRSIGLSLSAAIIGVVLAQMSAPFGAHAIATPDGFRTGLFIGCGVALGAAALCLAIPTVRTTAAPTGNTESHDVEDAAAIR